MVIERGDKVVEHFFEVLVERIVETMAGRKTWAFIKESGFYIGGSVPSLALSIVYTNYDELVRRYMDGKLDILPKEVHQNQFKEYPHGIHIYGKDYIECNRKFTNFVMGGNHSENRTQYVRNLQKIHYFTPSFQDFRKEVLELYKTDIYKVGYHKDEKLIVSRSMLLVLNNNYLKFNIPNDNREEELRNRAMEWFGKKCNVVELDPEEKSPLEDPKDPEEIPDTFEEYGPYLQVFHNKFRCIRCGVIRNKSSVCLSCVPWVVKKDFLGVRAFVLGRNAGFGDLVTKELRDRGFCVNSTSRKPDDGEIEFAITHDIPDTMQPRFLDNFIILNEFESIYTLDKSEIKLDLQFAEVVRINIRGYECLFDELVSRRMEAESSTRTVMVLISTDEYKIHGNYIDKHSYIELDASKAVIKQIIRNTYQDSFALYGIITVYYDPGSVLGSPRSRIVIPQEVAMRGLMHIYQKISSNFEKYFERKEYIVDYSVYDFIQEEG